MRRILLVTTALVAFSAGTADAGPVLLAFGTTLFGGAVAGVLAGGIVWATVLGQAAVAGLLAGAQMLLNKPKDTGPTASEVTLNKIQPLTNGLILYGERMLGGTITARSTTAVGSKRHMRLHFVMPLACHEIEGVQEGWLGETLVWTKAQYDTDETAAVLPPEHWGQIAGPFQYGFVMLFHNGARNQIVETRYSDAATEWTTTSRGRGIAYVYFEADYNRDLFPRGSEEIRLRCRGKKVHDLRTGVTAYSANPFLCARDYALTPEGFGGIGWGTADIDDANIIAMANIADEAVPKLSGGTEPRYEFNGVLDTGTTPAQNLDRLSTSWGGWWTHDRGKLRFGGGAWSAPVLTITESMMVGPIRTRARRPFEDQFNTVKAVFAEPLVQFVATDLPVLASETYRAQDNGEELIRDLQELPGETSRTRGQRLMKLVLLKGRRQKAIEVPCSLEAWNVRLGDTVEMTVPRRGWTAKQFEVVGRKASIAPGQVRVTLSLIETDAALFDWTTSEETPHPAGPVPSLASPWEKPVVAPPSVTEELFSTRGGGGVKCRITLLSDSDNPFIDAWQFAWRLDAEPNDRIRSLRDTPEEIIADMAPGIYVFGARARNKRGIWSDWANSNPLEILGANTPPLALTGLTSSVVSGLITLRWRQSADLDVRQGGVIQIRHSADLAATWQTATSIGEAVPGASTMVTLPAIAGRYLVRPVDAEGTPGPAVSINTTAPDFQALVTEATVTESTGFAGTKTDCSVVSSRLGLDSGAVAGTYLFANVMNFGALKTVRLTANLAAEISDRSSLVDDRGDIDLWPSVDGAEDAEGDVQIYYRTSQDASPTWSAWTEFDRTNVTAWRIEFKAELTATDTRYLTEVVTLSVVAERV